MDSKMWYESNTIRGAVLSLAPVLGFIFRELGVEVADSELVQIILAIVGVIGLIGVIVGRFQARTTLRLK